MSALIDSKDGLNCNLNHVRLITIGGVSDQWKEQALANVAKECQILIAIVKVCMW